MPQAIHFSFAFDDGVPFAGFVAGGTWNGFDNVCVTLATAHEIDRYFAVMCSIDGVANQDDPIADMPQGPEGLINLSNGYATVIVD